MSHRSAIAKGRFRYGLPGRQTQALSMAIQASIYGAQQDKVALEAFNAGCQSVEIPTAAAASSGRSEGLQKHLERVEKMDPEFIIAEAARKKYGPLNVKSIRQAAAAAEQPLTIPNFNPPQLIGPPTEAIVVAAASGSKNKVRKPRSVGGKKTVVMAEIAPQGVVVPASEVVPVLATIVGASSGTSDFLSALEHYAKHKAHGKTTMYEYVKGQLDKGNRYDSTTKRWKRK